MWIARIARPWAIYDASAAAKTSVGGELSEALELRGGGILENGEKEAPSSEKQEDSEHMPGFPNFFWWWWWWGAKGC